MFSLTRSVFVTPVVTPNSNYASGQCVGGLLKFTGLFYALKSGVLQSALLQMKSVQTAEFDLFLFLPTLTGQYVDKQIATIIPADIPLLIGKLSFTTAVSDLGIHTLYELNGIAKAVSGMGAPLPAEHLNGVLVTKGTPSFSSASDVTAALSVLSDA